MRIFFISLALVISGITSAQETNNNWWESYNNSSSKTAVRNKPDWSPMVTKIQASLNVDWMSGKAADGFEGSVGYSLGVSEDFFNDKNLGFEVGAYYSKSCLSMGIGDDYNTSIGLNYLEIQAMANPRLFFETSSVELNLGLAYNFGMWGSMSYKSKDLDVNPFSRKASSNGALLKNNHLSMLYGITFRWEHFYFRTLMHQGLTNIANVGSNKAYLWNWDLSIGYIF